MRLTTVILLASLMQVSAATFGQRITLSAKNTPLSSLLKEVRKQSGFDFYYDDKVIPGSKRINVKLENASLNEALGAVLEGLNLMYDVEDRIVTISRRPEKSVSKMTEVYAVIEVKGKVITNDGLPLPGATIRVKGTNKNVTSNTAGDFILRGVDEDATIVISFIGYVTKEIAAAANLGNISLVMSNSGLDEIQVVGYGTTTQRLSTGSVKSIKADEIGRQPVNSPLLALQGNVAGLYLAQSSGLPGAALNINIRGRNSIGAGNAPLYIVDGMPFNSQPIEQQAGGGYRLGANGDTSPFTSINPSDIESISVLKDADATAIYGSRAANGVVLITTKKGKAGRTDINVNVYSGFGNPSSKMELLNTEEYLDLRRQAFASDGITPNSFNAPDLLNWGTENKDFQKILIGNRGHVTEATASVSGGQKNTSFFVSGTYRNEGSVFPGSKGYERGSALLNASHASDDKRFGALASVSISKDKNSLTPQDVTFHALNLPPNYPLYNQDGTFFWENNFQNPLALLDNFYETKANNLRGTLSLGYELMTGLRLKTDFAYNRQQSDAKFALFQRNSGPNNTPTESTLSSNVTEGISIEPQINYNRDLGPGALQVVVGGTYQSSKAQLPYFAGLQGFDLEKQVFNMASAKTISRLINSTREYRYASVFGRVNYQINGRYILNVSGRRDGSSRFGPNKKFGNFGAVGAAWIFSEEDFIKKGASWLSFGKLRGSYGSVGNDQIADYGYLSTYRNNNFKYGSGVAFYPVRYANADYSWEATKKMELALELGFFNNRLLFTAAGFRNRTSSMLVDIPLSYQTGFTDYQGNFPAVVQNTGIELELNTTNIQKDNFDWKTSFNLTIPRNKLMSYPDFQSSTYAGEYIVGQPLSIINAYRVKNISNGLVEVEDVNGDGFISEGISENGRGDFVNAGYSDPKMYGGLTNSLRYKGLQLDVFLQFAKQTGFNTFYQSENAPGSMNNQHRDILKLGLKPTTGFDEAYDSFTRYALSDGAISDASYIRAKNISLSYNLPGSWVERMKFKSVNFYVRGQNLFTITNYRGLDPETQGISVPPLKMFIVGIQCSL